MKNFWQDLEKPIFALAPMADVTDAAFRRMFAKYGKPDVMFTEFVSSDGLCSAGRNKLLRELIYHESERPIVAQIWGRNPQNFYRSAKLITGLGFDGIDINLGCPQKKEMAQKTCAALIAEPERVGEIIRQTRRGAGDLPVSVKTRLGVKKLETEKWVAKLLSFHPDAIILHARTAAEMSKVPAHWEEVGKAVSLRNKLKSKTLILGNGDVRSLAEAKTRAKQTGCEGIMIGRAAFGNPWFFAPQYSNFKIRGIRRSLSEGGFYAMQNSLGEGGLDEIFDEGENNSPAVTLQERFAVMVEHARLFEKLFGRTKKFAVMRKHFKAYASGFEGAAGLRSELMQAEDSKAVKDIVSRFLKD